MRSASRLLTLTAVALLVGCGPRIEVRTMAAPDAGFAGLHGFRMLPGPAHRGPALGAAQNDPMIDNSIANRALRQQVVAAFLDRGYEESVGAADFAVAFYASAREKLDVSAWDYGYPFFPRWGAAQQSISTFTEGTVIVDVLRSTDLTLLWRGEGRATLTDDPKENLDRLGFAARKIIERFPRSNVVNVATQR